MHKNISVTVCFTVTCRNDQNAIVSFRAAKSVKRLTSPISVLGEIYLSSFGDKYKDNNVPLLNVLRQGGVSVVVSYAPGF